MSQDNREGIPTPGQKVKDAISRRAFLQYPVKAAELAAKVWWYTKVGEVFFNLKAGAQHISGVEQAIDHLEEIWDPWVQNDGKYHSSSNAPAYKLQANGTFLPDLSPTLLFPGSQPFSGVIGINEEKPYLLDPIMAWGVTQRGSPLRDPRYVAMVPTNLENARPQSTDVFSSPLWPVDDTTYGDLSRLTHKANNWADFTVQIPGKEVTDLDGNEYWQFETYMRPFIPTRVTDTETWLGNIPQSLREAAKYWSTYADLQVRLSFDKETFNQRLAIPAKSLDGKPVFMMNPARTDIKFHSRGLQNQDSENAPEIRLSYLNPVPPSLRAK